MRAVAGVLTLVFGLAASLQWNDPDPLVWSALYLLLAAASLGRALDRAWTPVEALAALTAAVLVALRAPALAGARSEAFLSFQMRSPEDELVRELGGAMLGLLWSLVLLFRRIRARRSGLAS